MHWRCVGSHRTTGGNVMFASLDSVVLCDWLMCNTGAPQTAIFIAVGLLYLRLSVLWVTLATKILWHLYFYLTFPLIGCTGETWAQYGKVLVITCDRLFLTLSSCLITVGFKLLLEVFSVIHGPQEECVRALKNGHLLAISPGGVREALFSDETYPLLWGKRKGFAQVAIDSRAVRCFSLI